MDAAAAQGEHGDVGVVDLEALGAQPCVEVLAVGRGQHPVVAHHERLADWSMILRFGTEFDDGLVLRDKDVAEAISSMREKIRRLEKLCGKAVILEGETLLTTYCPSKRRLKKFLRKRT